MTDTPSPQRRRPSDETGRTPLLLIIVLVYVIFFATAAASILFFFPQTTLPRQLQFEGVNISRIFSGLTDRLTAQRPAPSPREEPSGRLSAVWQRVQPTLARAGDLFRKLGQRLAVVWQGIRDSNTDIDRPRNDEGEVRWARIRSLLTRLRSRQVAEEPLTKIVAAEDQLDDLRMRLLASTEEINQVAMRLIEMIEIGDLPDGERGRSIAGVRERAQTLTGEAERDYLAQIASKESEIFQLRRELTARGVDPATLPPPRTPTVTRVDAGRNVGLDQLNQLQREHRAEIDKMETAHSQREQELQRKHQLALSRVEARYNPRFESESLKQILDRSAPVSDAADPPAYRSVLRSESVVEPEEYVQLTQQAEDLEALTERLLEVPYSGSVPVALQRIRDAGRSLSSGYGEMWSDLADRLEERTQSAELVQRELVETKTEAKRVVEAVDRFARDTRENGYVLDPYDPQNILLHISRLHAPKVGDLVYVFHEDDHMVATLLVTAAGDAVRARLLQPADDDRPVLAFDKLLLSVETNG